MEPVEMEDNMEGALQVRVRELGKGSFGFIAAGIYRPGTRCPCRPHA